MPRGTEHEPTKDYNPLIVTTHTAPEYKVTTPSDYTVGLEAKVAYARECFHQLMTCTTKGHRPYRLAKLGLKHMDDGGLS